MYSTDSSSRSPELGRLGEEAVALDYKSRGFQVLAQNWNTARGELDIIAQKGELLVFVEVKSAHEGAEIQPWENLTARKQERLRMLGELFLAERGKRLGISKVRFDAALVIFSGEDPEITILEDILN